VAAELLAVRQLASKLCCAFKQHSSASGVSDTSRQPAAAAKRIRLSDDTNDDWQPDVQMAAQQHDEEAGSGQFAAAAADNTVHVKG
jgi:hypothetical protein